MKRFIRLISAVQTSIREMVGASAKSYCRSAGGLGSGAGRGGRKAGAIRESGGAFGERAAAEEEGYFYRKTREQLEKLKKAKEKSVRDKAKK